MQTDIGLSEEERERESSNEFKIQFLVIGTDSNLISKLKLNKD